MDFLDRIRDAYSMIVKSVAASDGILSKHERDAIDYLRDLCEKVLSMDESMQRLKEWKNVVEDTEP